jgi:uncharacterized protein YraI
MKLPTRLLAGAAALLLTTGIAAAATVVADTPLNIRSGPGIQYPIVGVIRDGGSAWSRGCQFGWCHVDYHGVRGWSSGAYLTSSAVAVAPPAVAVAPPYYAQPYYYGSPGIGIGLGPFGFLGWRG